MQDVTYWKIRQITLFKNHGPWGRVFSGRQFESRKLRVLLDPQFLFFKIKRSAAKRTIQSILQQLLFGFYILVTPSTLKSLEPFSTKVLQQVSIQELAGVALMVLA